MGRVCTRRICVDWPTVPATVPYSDFAEADGDFRLRANLVGGFWVVEAEVVGVPTLRFGWPLQVYLRR